MVSHLEAIDLQFYGKLLISIGMIWRSFTSKPLKMQDEVQTLNQRVPGSSPGAPTKPNAFLFNKLVERSREQNGSRAIFVIARRATS
jgi:hypothetical protein